VLVFVLLALSVVAQDDPVPIPRYSDFPLDNIHILRLQAASEAIAQNVSSLEHQIADFKQVQTQELSQMRRAFEEYQRTQLGQMKALREQVESASGRPAPPREEVPATQYPPALITLLSVNVVLLLVAIVLIIYLRGRYSAHTKFRKELAGHIHPAPDNLVEHVRGQLKKKSVQDIRLDLADKGWSPSIIEHAIHAAKERE